MSLEQFSVTWDSFQTNIRTSMKNLLENEDFVDVTLAVEGCHVKAHKMVLSMCSPYFRDLFKTSPCKHPIVFMKDVSYDIMRDLLQFMYQGEVQVSQEKFTTFIKTAESLQIKGLRGLSNYSNDSAELNQQRNSAEQEMPKSQKSDHTSAKRPRLSEPPSTTQPATVKPVSEVEETVTTNEIQLKVEPVECENSFIDDIPGDPLAGAVAEDTSEDFWVTEGGDESESGTSGNAHLEAEESITSDTEEPSLPSLVPEISKGQYEYAFNRFEQWCSEQGVKTITEDVLLTYFKDKLGTCKPTSLWSIYSILKSMISIKRNQDIGTYSKLLAFLKNQSVGYQVKSSKTLKREDFYKFLRDADDYTYLMMKVVMIIAVAGGCHRLELTNLLTENVIDEGSYIRIIISHGKKSSRKFILTAGNFANLDLVKIVRKYIFLRPEKLDHRRFFVNYRKGRCNRQVVGIHTFGAIPKNIATFLGLPNPELYTGHCFKKTSALLKLW